MNNFVYKWLFRPYRRICNVLVYAKQGWETEDWDYEYFLREIEFKLNRMHIYLLKEHIVEPECFETINDTLKALRFWIDTDHYEIYEKALNLKWGKLKRLHKESEEDEVNFYILKREKETKENEAAVSKDERIAIIKSRLAERTAKYKFFTLLANNIESWWS